MRAFFFGPPFRPTVSRTRANISLPNGKDERVARVEIGGRRAGQEVWARWIDGTVQGDREFLKVAGLDPDTRFEDPYEFVELIQALLDKGSATVVRDIPPGQSPSPPLDPRDPSLGG